MAIHTKDESKRGTAFAFIFGVNWLWRCGATAWFGAFFHEQGCQGWIMQQWWPVQEQLQQDVARARWKMYLMSILAFLYINRTSLCFADKLLFEAVICVFLLFHGSQLTDKRISTHILLSTEVINCLKGFHRFHRFCRSILFCYDLLITLGTM